MVASRLWAFCSLPEPVVGRAMPRCAFWWFFWSHTCTRSSPQKDILRYLHLSEDIPRHALIRISQRICIMDIKEHLWMDINMVIRGYLLLISKDIFFHSRQYRVYPAISFISSNSFYRYPTVYPFISCFLSLLIHSYPVFYPALYPDISTSNPTFLSWYILLFIPLYTDIYPAGYSIRFFADPARRGVLLDRTLFCMSCSATG